MHHAAVCCLAGGVERHKDLRQYSLQPRTVPAWHITVIKSWMFAECWLKTC
jgi:hypothetical protein